MMVLHGLGDARCDIIWPKQHSVCDRLLQRQFFASQIQLLCHVSICSPVLHVQTLYDTKDLCIEYCISNKFAPLCQQQHDGNKEQSFHASQIRMTIENTQK